MGFVEEDGTSDSDSDSDDEMTMMEREVRVARVGLDEARVIFRRSVDGT
jgi:hypothetical protein